MRRDPKMAAVLSAYFLPILRCNWAVDPEGTDRSEAVDLVAADLGLPVLGEKSKPKDSPIRGFRWHEHVRLALLSLVFGLMPFERWFTVRDGRTHLSGIQERLPHTITNMDIADDGTMRSVEQSTQLTPIPANRLTWYVNQREGANWAGVSLLRPCYSSWILKAESLRVHATAIRRFGMGVPVVHAPAGATPAQIEEARRLAAGMRAGDQAGAGLPDGFSFELTGVSGGTPDAVAFVNFLNQEIAGSALAKVIELGTTSEGSRALGDTFLDLFLLALQAGADQIGDTATYGDPAMPGLSRALVDYNWGEDEPCPRIVATDVGDRHEITAAAIQQLVACGAITPDDNLEAFLREAWSLPARTTPRPPAAPPPGTRSPGTPTPEPPGGGPQPGGGGGPGLPPSSSPHQPQAPAAAAPRSDGLRRDLTPVEAAAGLDPEAMHRELQTDTDRVLRAWAPILAEQRADLADQVSAAVDDGHLDKLAAITAPTGDAAEVLYRAMASAAARAAGRMIGEAAGQGVTIDPATVRIDHARLRKLAAARAAMAGSALAAAASRRALQVVTASAGTQAAQQVTVTLAGLSTTPLADELMAALHAATNEARFAVLDAGPEAKYTASEVRDQNSCPPCLSIDGYQFPDLASARAAYAAGGFTECDGGLRCRGTVVASWEQPPEPGTPEAYEEGLYGPLGQHLSPSSWQDIGTAATAGDEEPRPFDAAWDERKHPRRGHGKDGGQFTRTPGSTVEAPPQAPLDPSIGVSETITRFSGEGATIIRSIFPHARRVGWRRTETMPIDGNESVLGYMSWDGRMQIREDKASSIAKALDSDGAINDPLAFQVILHELIHSVGGNPKDPGPDIAAYQTREGAYIEEGFTELGATQHAPEFFSEMDIGDRATPIIAVEHGHVAEDKQGNTRHATMAEYAQRLADPIRIGKGQAWGAYPAETSAAQEWCRKVAAEEGLGRRGEAVQARIRELADEVNSVGPSGKPQVLAMQVMRAMGISDQETDAGRLSELIASGISKNWIKQDSLKLAVKTLGRWRPQ